MVLFLIWNARSTPSFFTGETTNDVSASIPPEINIAIIKKFQESHPDWEPLETLFIKPQKDGSYNSRVMFMNTRNFLGRQYDIQSQVSPAGDISIKNISESLGIDKSYGYVSDSYKPYHEVQSSLDTQFKQIISQITPMDTITTRNLQTRS